MKIDLVAIFGYLNDFAAVLIPLFSVFGVLAGLVLFGSAAKALVWNRRGGMQEEVPLASVGVQMFIGACLFQFGTSIDWTRSGMLGGAGSGTRAAMALVTPGSSSTWNLLLDTSFLWLAAIGVAGMFRGFLLWNKAGSGDNQGGSGDFFWRGLWHILGGAICINIGTS